MQRGTRSRERKCVPSKWPHIIYDYLETAGIKRKAASVGRVLVSHLHLCCNMRLSLYAYLHGIFIVCVYIDIVCIQYYILWPW